MLLIKSEMRVHADEMDGYILVYYARESSRYADVSYLLLLMSAGVCMKKEEGYRTMGVGCVGV